MVQLEEVKDSELNAAQPGPVSDEFEDDADFTDTGITPFWPISPPSVLIIFPPFAYAPSKKLLYLRCFNLMKLNSDTIPAEDMIPCLN